MVFLAHIDSVIQNLFDFDVRSKVFLVVVVSTFENAVDSERSNANWFHDISHSFVEVLHAVVYMIFLTNFETLFNGKPTIFLKSLHKMIRLMFGHKFHKSQYRLFWQFKLHLSTLVIIDNSLKVLQLQKLIIGKSSYQLFLNFRHVVLNQDLSSLRLHTHHILYLIFYAVCQSVLLLLTLFKHKPFEWVFQELE